MAHDLSPAAQSTSTTDATPMASFKAVSDPRAALEDAIAQLEVARQQRTEVSSELYKYRLMVDELKEQRVALQSELSRRLQLHKEDVDRVLGLQREMDTLRSSYCAKQAETLELSTRVQELLARVETTDQQRELKAENDLLWRKFNELKRSEPAAEAAEVEAKSERWKSRFEELETVVMAAFEERRAALGPDTMADSSCDQLTAILSLEETLRRSLVAQLNALKTELRAVRDENEDLNQKSQASIRFDLELKKQVATQITDLEALRTSLSLERDSLQREVQSLRSENEALVRATAVKDSLHSQLEALKKEVAKRDEALTRQAESLQHTCEALQSERDSLSGDLERLTQCNLLLENKIRDLEDLVNALEPQAKVLENQVKILDVDKNTLESENEGLRLRVQALTDELEQTEGASEDELRKQMLNLETEVAAARLFADARVLEAAQRAEHLTELNERLRETTSTLQMKYEQTAQELNERDTELEGAKEEIDQQRDEISELRTHLATAQQQNYSTREAVLETQHAEVVNALDKANGDRSRLEHELECIMGECSSVQLALTQLQQETQTDRKEVRLLLQSLQDENEQKELKIQELQQEKEAAATSRIQESEAISRIEEIENASRIEELQTEAARVPELQLETERVRTELVQRTQQLREAQSKLASTVDQAQTLRGGQAKLESENTALGQQVKQLTEQVAELRTALNEVLDGPSVDTLLASDPSKSISDEQQILKLKAALNKAVATAKEQEALAEIARERAKERQLEIVALKTQVQNVEDGWKVEYDGYLGNLHRVNHALEKAQEDRSRLEGELQRTKLALSVAKAKPSPVADGIPEADRVKWGKERKALERTLDETRRKLTKTQNEVEKSRKVAESEELHRNSNSQGLSWWLVCSGLFLAVIVAYLCGALTK